MKKLLIKHRKYYQKAEGSVYKKRKNVVKNLLSIFNKIFLLPLYFKCFGLKRTLIAVISYLQYQLNFSRLYTLPKKLTIESSGKCSHTCIQCIRATEKYDSSTEGFMSFEDFVQIFNQFPPLEKLNFAGVGEPSFNKDLFKMINYAKSKKHSPLISITSNGLIVTGEIFKKLINSRYKPDELIISLDAFKKETYDNIKKTNLDFEQILKNIKKLTLNKDFKNTEICISMVVMEPNYKEIVNFVKLAHKIGVNNINFIDLYSGWVHKKNKYILIKDSKKLKKLVSEAKKTAEKLGILMTYKYTNSNIWGKEKSYYPCYYPWLEIWITCQGYVTPCCYSPFIYTRQNYFGNLLTNNLKNIWNSEKYISLRKILISKKLPKICGSCFCKH